MSARDDDGLFSLPGKAAGPGERAVAASIRSWRAQGRDIDAATSLVLRRQGRAIDKATDRDDPWQIGNANRVYLELVQGFHLVGQAAADPFDQLLAAIADDAAAPVPDQPTP